MLSHQTLDRVFQNVNTNRNISKLNNRMPPSLIIRMVSVNVKHRVSNLNNRMPPSLIIRMVSVNVKHRVSNLNNRMPPSLIIRMVSVDVKHHVSKVNKGMPPSPTSCMWLLWKLSNMKLKLDRRHRGDISPSSW